MRFTSIAVTTFLVWRSSASPIVPRQEDYQVPSPCAAIYGLVQAAPSPSAPIIAAEPAWNCLQSVPLNTTAALALMESIRPYLQFQSTTSYIKNPPLEYAQKIQPPVDILAGFDSIVFDLKTGKWTKEYDFGYALYRLLQSSHDGHFTYFPDSIFSIFTWGRPVPLVSVSEDGYKTPSIFVYADILASSGNATLTPSAVIKVNGDDAIEFLADFSQAGSLQDRDALWNNLFYELAQISLGTTGSGTGSFSGGGRGRVIYPGPVTELTFANGSTHSYPNYARVLVDFEGITSGEDLYEKFFTYVDTRIQFETDPTETTTPTPSASTTSTVSPTATTTPAPGYPPPVIREIHNLIGGYYLDDPAYTDVAVLGIPSFVGTDAQVEFQDTAQQFITLAKAAGKTKLIIDVSANGGGTILLGYDLFKQLFPQIDPYAASDRLRAHQALDLIGQTFSEVSGEHPRTLDENEYIVDIESTPMNYRSDLVPPSTTEHFTSWPQKYGPFSINGDYFTHTWRWDFNDPLTLWNSGGIEVTGYANRTNFTQPFAAEDVVIVYDGYCASTCTIFSELMRDLAGVEAVAMGGRPTTDLIQAVGGTKGTNNWGWSYIQSLVQETYNFSSPAERASYASTDLARYADTIWLQRASGAPNVNARDGIKKGDYTNTPLQFKYEDADCRLFYTPQMTVDVTAMWKAVADTKWFGKQKCVAGHLGGKGYRGEGKKWPSKKRELTKRAAVGKLTREQLRALKNSLELETDTWLGRVADGVMVP